jgi:hypothetical protein
MDQPFLLVGVVILIVIIFNALLLYYLKEVYGRDKQIAEFIKSNDTLILSEAQQKAKSIIEAATIRAKQTITETDYVKAELMKKVENLLNDEAHKDVQLLQNKSYEINDWYKKLLAGVEQQHAKKAEETLNTVENIATEELEDFREILKKETMESEQVVSQKVNSEYQKVHLELEGYKAKKMQEINQAANKIVLEVTEEVLGKAISLDEHQKIIVDALEKAKRDGLFNIPT